MFCALLLRSAHQACTEWMVRANHGKVSPQPWEGRELTQAIHETFDSRVTAVTSRQQGQALPQWSYCWDLQHL